MNKLKKIIASVLVLCMVISAVTAFAAENITVQDNENADTVQSGKALNVLAIGNSFTKDSMTYVYDIAKNAGFNVNIGVLWKGSQALHNHLDFISDNSPVYTYELYSDDISGNKRVLENTSASKAFAEYKWDRVILQQTSYGSAVSASFFDEDGNSYLKQMTDTIQNKIQNPNLSFDWLMSWSYDKKYVDHLFKMFDNNQLSMYREIVSTMQSTILPTGLFSKILPAGTAIQNLRESYIGDNLNRDGRHLTFDFGRYEAGLAVAAALGADITQVSYIPPEHSFSKLHLPALKKAALDAVNTPYVVTPTAYKRAPVSPSVHITQASNEKDGILLKWDINDPSAKYIIYKAEDSGKMRKTASIKNYKSFSYLDTQAKNGKYYRYSVNVIYDKYLSPSKSSVSSAYFLRTPRILNISSYDNAQDSIKVEIGKNKSADAYQIRYAEKDYKDDESQYRMITSAKRNARLTGLEQGKVYCVQVRCRMIKKGKAWYSAWSSAREYEINRDIQNIEPATENFQAVIN